MTDALRGARGYNVQTSSRGSEAGEPHRPYLNPSAAAFAHRVGDSSSGRVDHGDKTHEAEVIHGEIDLVGVKLEAFGKLFVRQEEVAEAYKEGQVPVGSQRRGRGVRGGGGPSTPGLPPLHVTGQSAGPIESVENKLAGQTPPERITRDRDSHCGDTGPTALAFSTRPLAAPCDQLRIDNLSGKPGPSLPI